MVAQLGSGGMADVFLAMRKGMGGFVKLVVIKRLRKDIVEGEGVAMFQDEARISARLNHPNVVHTHEVGFDGEHFRLEMEYLDGQPLHRILHRMKKAGRALDDAMAVAIVHDVLAGLHYAHELCDYDGSPLSIVHRDVSPQNVFITYEGGVKVVDFGIAKAAGQLAVTQLGVVKGKVRYMAPEQAVGLAIDRRADVFATGIVLWQLLTGQRFWGDLDELVIVQKLVSGDFPPNARSVRPDVDERLDRVCARALARDPNDRWATADEMRRALEEACPAHHGARARLGKLTAELFDDVRKEVRAAIEKAAARPVPEDEPPTLAQSMSISRSASSDEAQPVTRSTRPTERRRRRMFRAAGAVTVLGTAVAVASTFVVPAKNAVRLEKRPALALRLPSAPRPVETAAPAHATTSTTTKATPSRTAPRATSTQAVAVRETPKETVDAGAPATAATATTTARGVGAQGLLPFTGDPWNAGSH